MNYTLTQAAEVLGVTFSRITYAEKNGKFPKPTKIYNRILYSEDDLVRMNRYFKDRKPWSRVVGGE